MDKICNKAIEAQMALMKWSEKLKTDADFERACYGSITIAHFILDLKVKLNQIIDDIDKTRYRSMCDKKNKCVIDFNLF